MLSVVYAVDLTGSLLLSKMQDNENDLPGLFCFCVSLGNSMCAAFLS